MEMLFWSWDEFYFRELYLFIQSDFQIIVDYRNQHWVIVHKNVILDPDHQMGSNCRYFWNTQFNQKMKYFLSLILNFVLFQWSMYSSNSFSKKNQLIVDQAKVQLWYKSNRIHRIFPLIWQYLKLISYLFKFFNVDYINKINLARTATGIHMTN